MATNSKPCVYFQNSNEVTKALNQFDRNGDGKISATELDEVLKSLGSNRDPKDVKRVMEELDTNHDKIINLFEFAKFYKGSIIGDGEQSDEGGERKLQDAFSLFDQDKNRLISVTKLHMVLNRLGEMCTVQDCNKMITLVDADGDGNVNFKEFRQMMTNSGVKTLMQ